MRQLFWGRTGRRDLIAIADRYAQYDPTLPEQLIERIEHAPLVLLDHPKIGSPIAPGVRKWTARETPFVLLYAVRADAIEIRRVHHAKEDWRPRGIDR